MTPDLARPILGRRFAILTANAPQHTVLATGGNTALAEFLRCANQKFYRVQGVYQGTPDGESFLVPELSVENARAYGVMFGQDSVLTDQGMVYTQREARNPLDGTFLTGRDALASDYYTILPSGEAFSLGIDFDTELPL